MTREERIAKARAAMWAQHGSKLQVWSDDQRPAIVAILDAAPDLFALIDDQAKELERRASCLVDCGEAEWCGLECGTLILDGDERHVVGFEHDDDTAPCCAACYASLKDAPKETA